MKKVTNLNNWISELPKNIEEEVKSRFSQRSLTDGECLYSGGGLPDVCFQVAKGRLKVCNANATGQELVHIYLIAGDCIGDLGLIINQPRINSVYSCGDSDINILNKKHFDQLYQKHPEIPQALNRVMARRIQMLFMTAENASLLTLRQRVARAIIQLGYSLGHTDDKSRTLIKGISQEEVAKMVGSPRQSVGRELKKFKNEGSLSIEYRTLIINNLVEFAEHYEHLLTVEPVVPNYKARRYNGR